MQHSPARTAFASGDYCGAALQSGEDALLRGMAYVMMGYQEAGVPLLDGVETSEALYYRAVGFWGLDRPDEARQCVARCVARIGAHDPWSLKAARLGQLIARERIRVLVQARDQGVVRGMKAAPQFDVISIGHSAEDDLLVMPYESMDSLLQRLPAGWVPDLYIAHQPEFDMIPVDLDTAPFPLLAFTSDYDVQIHNCFHQLRLFDTVVVTDTVDHQQVAQGFGMPTISFSKVFSNIDRHVGQLPPQRGRRDVDLFFSGTAFHSDHDDKSRLLFRLTQLSDRYTVHMINHYLPPWKYVALAERSKCSFTYVRRPRGFPSRALDVLARGTAVLYQEGGSLGCYFSEEEGAIPYWEDNVESVVERVVGQWETRYAAAAMRGRSRVLREFTMQTCMSRYLKFLALTAVEIRRDRRDASHLGARLRYPHNVYGMQRATPDYNITAYMRSADSVRRADPEGADPYASNLLGVMYAMAYYYNRELLGNEQPGLLDGARQTLTAAAARFPEQLYPVFNCGRICYHSGALSEARKYFDRVLMSHNWQCDPLDHCFPTDFFPAYFPYRRYIDALIQHLADPASVARDRLIQIVRSSAWAYLARIHAQQGDGQCARTCIDEAVALLPDFAAYHLLAYQLWGAEAPGAVRSDPARALMHLREACTITPHLLHEQIGAFVELSELVGDTNTLDRLRQEVGRWQRFVLARPDVQLTDTMTVPLRKYLDVAALHDAKAKAMARVRRERLPWRYVMVKVGRDPAKAWRVLWAAARRQCRWLQRSRTTHLSAEHAWELGKRCR